jgi:hypothetical protein
MGSTVDIWISNLPGRLINREWMQGVNVTVVRTQMYIQRSVTECTDPFGCLCYKVACYTGVATGRAQLVVNAVEAQKRVTWVACEPAPPKIRADISHVLRVLRPITRLPKRNDPPRRAFQPTSADIVERGWAVLETHVYTRSLSVSQFAAMQHIPLIAAYAAYLKKYQNNPRNRDGTYVVLGQTHAVLPVSDDKGGCVG